MSFSRVQFKQFYKKGREERIITQRDVKSFTAAR